MELGREAYPMGVNDWMEQYNAIYVYYIFFQIYFLFIYKLCKFSSLFIYLYISYVGILQERYYW